MKVYNTLTREKEEFRPIRKEVGMYVCGLTVYDNAHIGHARTYVAFDMIKRYLKHKGFRVKHVQNITDVEDKMIKRAREEGTTIFELAERVNASAMKDFDDLNIERADVYPKATEHIPEMIELIKKLIGKGYAYVSDGDVYYDVRKVMDYGKLSHQDRDQMMAAVRIETNPKKRDLLDFALWKAKKEGEPSWKSPWGEGRPGWHIECSAMSMKYLGETFDIHGGAQDLIFPHHENEIIQSEAATEKQFVRYWFHTGFLTVNGEKMSKSLGNVITIRDILATTEPAALRLFYLQSQYRSQIYFSREALKEAEANLKRVREFLERMDQTVPNLREDPGVLRKIQETKRAFFEAMDDDFNTPTALSEIYTLIRFGNTYLDEHKRIGKKARKAVMDTLLSLLGILGIEITLLDSKTRELVEKLIKERQALREKKEYAASDLLRKKLAELGIVLKDGKDATLWSLSKKPSKNWR